MNVTLITRKAGHLPGPVTMTSTSGRLKILALGDSFVGKSTLIKAYCEEKFISDYIPTIGIDFGVRTTKIEDVEIKINFWDVAGDPLYYEVRNEFYKDTHGIMLVFDLSVRKTFEDLIQWLAEINRFIRKKEIVVHLIGNKSDKEPRLVSYEEAVKFAMKNNFKYTEISSKDIDGVCNLFQELFIDVINSYKNQDGQSSQQPKSQQSQSSQPKSQQSQSSQSQSQLQLQSQSQPQSSQHTSIDHLPPQSQAQLSQHTSIEHIPPPQSQASSLEHLPEHSPTHSQQIINDNRVEEKLDEYDENQEENEYDNQNEITENTIQNNTE
ncbi:P-loop containing nucleoside triphosphate hydrolase protein [Anaeromyces robustus]|uniref:p-loop containing nucleoside triphosphate hydrolase protein n=1 Tax=Anaeromyces robustus TaxID=1754192 RepID=A0A1Y1VRR5_9FUNG|nr:P-loop containing nucleoside triphosphate hydrolase protein [Anaeromyces robustus]|eukprot:ORX63981.1 P-loop containing nucleoside triphosphate hydrolase protein [Anaeromyces robustus]